MSITDPRRAPALPRNAPTGWGFEYLAKVLAPCHCGGIPQEIEVSGTPKQFRVFCPNPHSKENNGRPCNAGTQPYDSQAEANVKWNEQRGNEGFDLRLLHPLNIKSL